MEIQAGVDVYTMLEGHVNAGQLLGDLEHSTSVSRAVLSQATLSFTVNNDVKCIVLSKFRWISAWYCLCQSSHAVICHP